MDPREQITESKDCRQRIADGNRQAKERKFVADQAPKDSYCFVKRIMPLPLVHLQWHTMRKLAWHGEINLHKQRVSEKLIGRAQLPVPPSLDNASHAFDAGR